MASFSVIVAQVLLNLCPACRQGGLARHFQFGFARADRGRRRAAIPWATVPSCWQTAPPDGINQVGVGDLTSIPLAGARFGLVACALHAQHLADHGHGEARFVQARVTE
jgi:hypothetical protein